MQKLGDIVSERALAAFAGRERELEALLELFEKSGPLALHVHGVAGIGKSSLLEAFAARVRARGGGGGRIYFPAGETTGYGVFIELSGALGEAPSTGGGVVGGVSAVGGKVGVAPRNHW